MNFSISITWSQQTKQLKTKKVFLISLFIELFNKIWISQHSRCIFHCSKLKIRRWRRLWPETNLVLKTTCKHEIQLENMKYNLKTWHSTLNNIDKNLKTFLLSSTQSICSMFMSISIPDFFSLSISFFSWKYFWASKEVHWKKLIDSLFLKLPWPGHQQCRGPSPYYSWL